MMVKDRVQGRITQDDVAKRAGVSRSVVSYVLSGSSRTVAPETREKILKAIDELGYRPNKFAQGLMRSRRDVSAVKQIGIVLTKAEVLLRPYYAEILAGIHAAAHENDYHIRFIRFFKDLSNPILFNELIHHEEICGLILVSLDQSIANEHDERIISNIRSRIMNIVCVEWQHEGLASVNFDRQGAAYNATAYLLDRGYSDIAYIGESDNRIAGFKQALLDSGRNDLSVLKLAAAFDMRGGFDRIAAFHAEAALPRAVVAGSDEVAIGILRYLNMKRIAIPDDIAIISIDNIEMAEFTNPPLTTINVQKAAMGRQAVQMVIANERNRRCEVVSLILPTTMIVRESC